MLTLSFVENDPTAAIDEVMKYRFGFTAARHGVTRLQASATCFHGAACARAKSKLSGPDEFVEGRLPPQTNETPRQQSECRRVASIL